jgi:hypothetical protein
LEPVIVQQGAPRQGQKLRPRKFVVRAQ